MSRGWVMMAVLAAGCAPGAAKHGVNAELEAHTAAGDVILTCRASSTGACHALFSTDDKTARIQAPVGGTSAASGIGPDTQYCLDSSPPQDGCRLVALREGEQIVRTESLKAR
ncbi:MAG: hypothetical protein WDN44_02945 [Sphingomonas sp.]